MKRNGANLTEGKPVKLILQFAIPVFLGNLFQLFYGLIDTKIVGSTLGEGALAAVGSVSILYNLLTGFFNGLTLGFSVVTARYFGAGDNEKLKECCGDNSFRIYNGSNTGDRCIYFFASAPCSDACAGRAKRDGVYLYQYLSAWDVCDTCL